MRIRTLVIATAGAVLVAGCQLMGGHGGSKGPGDVSAADTLPCQGGPSAPECKVLVKKPILCLPFRKCYPSVDNEKVVVTGGANDITWILTRGQWRGGGIVFSYAGIRCDPPTGAKVVCHNDGKTGEWKYDVLVEGLEKLDPWVVNN